MSAPEEADDQRADDAVRESVAKTHAGDLAGAQAVLLAYLDTTAHRPPKLLASLFYTLIELPELPEPRLRAFCDEALALAVKGSIHLRTPALVDNLAFVLNNAGRGADAFLLCERAIKGGYFSHACYVNGTRGARESRDRTLMIRAAAMVDKIAAKNPRKLAGFPGAFENAAMLQLALGNPAKALECVVLCKQLGYERFAQMRDDPDFAALRGMPAFAQLFE